MERVSDGLDVARKREETSIRDDWLAYDNRRWHVW